MQVRAPRVQVRAPVSSGLEACGTMRDSIATSAQLFAAHLCTYASWAESWEINLRRAPRLVSHLKRAGVRACQGLPNAGQSTRAQARTSWANSVGEQTMKSPYAGVPPQAGHRECLPELAKRGREKHPMRIVVYANPNGGHEDTNSGSCENTACHLGDLGDALCEFVSRFQAMHHAYGTRVERGAHCVNSRTDSA